MITLETMADAIKAFGETPTTDTTKVDELEQAEDDIKQRDTDQIDKEQQHIDDQSDTSEEDDMSLTEDESDDGDVDIDNPDDDDTATLQMMTPEQLLMVRFMPFSMEYGTPSGADNQSTVGRVEGCPGCSDAADAAIIDAEITPSDGSEDNDEADMSEELHAYLCTIRKLDEYRSNGYIEGNENFVYTFATLIGVAVNIVTKVIKYARKTWKFVRNNLILTNKRLGVTAKFWNFKLKDNLSNVDMERLNTYEANVLPYDIWIKAAHVALTAYDLVQHADTVVFDSSPDGETRSMTDFAGRVEQLEIHIDMEHNRIDISELLDKRSYESVQSAGYTKNNLPNVLRYCSDMGKCVSADNKQAKSEKISDAILNKITHEATKLSDDVKQGRLEKGSEEYQNRVNWVANLTLRLDFILTIARLYAMLFDELSKDAQNVFSKYEDAISWSKIV